MFFQSVISISAIDSRLRRHRTGDAVPAFGPVRPFSPKQISGQVPTGLLQSQRYYEPLPAPLMPLCLAKASARSGNLRDFLTKVCCALRLAHIQFTFVPFNLRKTLDCLNANVWITAPG